ncbi:hypothetical protein [Methylomonas sp. MgM2]
MSGNDWQLRWIKYKYFKENNLKYLVDLLRSKKTISDGTRDFIADILTGDNKRRKGRTANLRLDLFYDYEKCLKTGMTYEQADEDLSHYYPENNKGFGSFTKNYQRMKPVIEEIRKFAIEIARNKEELYFLVGDEGLNFKHRVEKGMPISIDDEVTIFIAFYSLSEDEKDYWRNKLGQK